jgi:hypothetical protein
MKTGMVFWAAVHARQKDVASGAVTITTTASTPPPPLLARLDDLVARAGSATEAECASLCTAVSREKLIARGAEVATPRVADDALRIFGRAYLFSQGAPKEVVAIVRLSPDVVRVGAWAAREAERRDEASRSQRASQRSHRAASAGAAKAAEKAAGAQAEQLAATLLNVVGGDVHTATRIKKASQPAAEGHTETSRGRVLATLVDEGRALLASKDEGVAARRGMFLLDEGYLAGCAAVAERARAASRAADAPAVAQGRSHADVDLWDGMALTIADVVVAAFATAHAIDARVPKLAYVALRARSGSKGNGAKAKAEARKDAAAKKDPTKR